MSRGYAALGVLLAGAFGVASMYTTLQPELETIRAEREGEPLPPDHTRLRNANDKVISDAITQDLKEAKDQVVQPGGFAWGIRQWLFDSKTPAEGTDSVKSPVIDQAVNSNGAKDGS